MTASVYSSHKHKRTINRSTNEKDLIDVISGDEIQEHIVRADLNENPMSHVNSPVKPMQQVPAIVVSSPMVNKRHVNPSMNSAIKALPSSSCNLGASYAASLRLDGMESIMASGKQINFNNSAPRHPASKSNTTMEKKEP